MDADAVVWELAGRQHGVVGRQQLLAVGVPTYAIDNRVRNGRLHSLYRGVYRVGPLRGRHEREMAARLACGVGAVVSHRSAAGLWKVIPAQGRATPVEVSVQGRRNRAPGPDVRVYRVAVIDTDELGTICGIPVTAPARTILDIAGVLSTGELERAVARAEREGLTEEAALRRLLVRHPRRPGTRALRSILERPGGASLTRSEPEALLLELVRRARLPAPRTNARVRGFEVDFLWSSEAVVVEVDGYRFHSSPTMFERDRKRDRTLTTAGFTVMRVTLRELREESEVVLAQLAQALALGRRRET